MKGFIDFCKREFSVVISFLAALIYHSHNSCGKGLKNSHSADKTRYRLVSGKSHDCAYNKVHNKFLLMEFIEHRAGDKLAEVLGRAGKKTAVGPAVSGWARSTGIASSEVAINTEISVPRVMTRPA